MSLLRLLVLFLGVGLLAGCGNGPPPEVKRVRVAGKVTLDSKPLVTGTITFDPQSGEAPAVLEILDGNYEGKAPLGKNRIMINAIQKVNMKEKMKMDGPGYDQLVDENLLPARYNTESQITREVEEGTENLFNFSVSAK